MDKVLKMLELHRFSQVNFPRAARWISLFAVAASLTFFSSSRAFAQDPAAADQQPQGQAPDEQNAPTPPQDERRVISRDNIPQNQNAQGAPDQDRYQNPTVDDSGPQQRRMPSNRRPYSRRQAVGDLPGTITITAGKVI